MVGTMSRAFLMADFGFSGIKLVAAAAATVFFLAVQFLMRAV